MPLFLIYASMKSYLAKPGEVKQNWYLVDAKDQVLGRLAVKIANILRGRNKPTYTPHVDTGDFVVVINAEKITVTGGKMEEKEYYDYSGYPGGLRITTLRVPGPDVSTAAAVELASASAVAVAGAGVGVSVASPTGTVMTSPAWRFWLVRSLRLVRSFTVESTVVA